MDLASLILELRNRGGQLTSWYGLKTNVESVNELKGKNGNYYIEIKTCKSDKNLQGLSWQDVRRIVQIADEMIDEDVKGNLEHLKSEEDYYTEVLRRFKNNDR